MARLVPAIHGFLWSGARRLIPRAVIPDKPRSGDDPESMP
jgi:hypothetical protein